MGSKSAMGIAPHAHIVGPVAALSGPFESAFGHYTHERSLEENPHSPSPSIMSKKQRYWFFAQEAMTLVKNPGKKYFENDKLATAVFRVAPSMKKPMIKEYLTQIYGMDVVKVNTANYDGKKYFNSHDQKMRWFKRQDWKKAVVRYKKPEKPEAVTA